MSTNLIELLVRLADPWVTTLIGITMLGAFVLWDAIKGGAAIRYLEQPNEEEGHSHDHLRNRNPILLQGTIPPSGDDTPVTTAEFEAHIGICLICRRGAVLTTIRMAGEHFFRKCSPRLVSVSVAPKDWKHIRRECRRIGHDLRKHRRILFRAR